MLSKKQSTTLLASASFFLLNCCHLARKNDEKEKAMPKEIKTYGKNDTSFLSGPVLLDGFVVSEKEIQEARKATPDKDVYISSSDARKSFEFLASEVLIPENPIYPHEINEIRKYTQDAYREINTKLRQQDYRSLVDFETEIKFISSGLTKIRRSSKFG